MLFLCIGCSAQSYGKRRSYFGKGSKGTEKCVFLTEEDRAKLQVSELPLMVSAIAEYLNSFVDLETTKKISAARINNWHLEFGFLELTELPDGKHRKIPTKQGNDIGIFTEERTGRYGTYIAVLFSCTAQLFIYDNIDTIISFKEER